MGSFFTTSDIGVSGWLEKVTHDAYVFDEVWRVLGYWLLQTKKLEVIYNRDSMCVVFRDGIQLFASESFTACVEFALKYEPPAP